VTAPRLLACAVAAAALPALAAARPAAAAGLHDDLRAAFDLYERGDMAAARLRFAGLAQAAADAGDGWAEAEARRGLGRVHFRTGRYAEAEAELEQALEQFLAIGDRLGATRCASHLAARASLMGEPGEARAVWEVVLREFEAMDAVGDQAETHYNLAYAATSTDLRRVHLERGSELAAAAGLPTLEGALMRARGELEYSLGDYGAAQDRLEQAAGLLEHSGNKADLARVFNSLARLERIHDRPEAAIALAERALAIQEQVEDREGAIQSLDHIADAQGEMGAHDRALALYDRALGMARRTGSPRAVEYVTGRMADAHLRQGRFARASALLEAALRGAPSDEYRHAWVRQLSHSYLHQGRRREALAAAEQAVALVRPSGRLDRLVAALRARARALEALNRLDAADADVSEQTRILEGVRDRLGPRDFLKQGFAQQYRATFEQGVTLMYARARPADALEASERARARAFLDLLASRGSRPEAAGPLASPARARPAGLADMIGIARRLRSTLVTYFVTEDATYIWVVDQAGLRASVRQPVGARALTRLVTRAAPESLPSAAPPPPRPTLVASRSGNVVLSLGRVRSALSELYGVLLQPVRRHLPHAPDARLTILPHGPLARLPFGALIDARGRYLVESYTLHTAPAAAVFSFTAEPVDAAGPPLFVGDPAAFPREARQRRLPALPATRDEVRQSAAALPAPASAVLLGAEATEANVRRRWAGAGLLHFATHAVVRDDAPFESFLALQPGGAAAEDDGRLTAAEVQSLSLPAGLVVLSACSTARGRANADGIVGLTRAFFTAGASSVVATLWDVPDEPSARIMASFYTHLARGLGRAGSLRAAQLEVLRALRRGRLRIETAAGPIALPEHPALWAGFVVLGEP
jgi:CHAT domain-containing protein/tetratricopeptide (TPR) repeat protein